MVFKQGKELAGVEVDLAHALGKHLQRKIVFVQLPWEEQIEALNAGRIDIIMSSMSVTMARRQVVEFTRPYFLTGQMALIRREDLHHYVLGFPMRLPGTVGVLEATTGDFLVQREFPKAKRKVVNTDQEAAQALAKKKIDLFISDSTLVWYLAGMYATKGLAAVRIALSEKPLAWAVRRGNPELLAGANGFLEKAKQSGELDRVFRRWMAIPE
jgi:polar amino acid transport system substrate-binding protein